jgi:hypothetical protein
MIVNFEKSSGVLPTPAKTAFEWGKYRPVWSNIKNVFEKYVDAQKKLRNSKQKYRQPFLKTLVDLQDDLKAEIYNCKRGAKTAGFAGCDDPVRGILYLESPLASEYANEIADPLSFAEIRANVEANRAYNTKGKEIEEFRAAITKVLKNAVRWHSKGKWIPDNENKDLDPNNCEAWQLEPDITKFKPYIVNQKDNVFTIRTILEFNRIPNSFQKQTLEQNAIKGLNTIDDEVNWKTSVLLPHRLDVAAVKIARNLLKSADEILNKIDEKMEAQTKVQKEDTEKKVQCSKCKNWRHVDDRMYSRFSKDDVDFRCVDAKRKCSEPDDDGDVELDDISEHLANMIGDDSGSRDSCGGGGKGGGGKGGSGKAGNGKARAVSGAGNATTSRSGPPKPKSPSAKSSRGVPASSSASSASTSASRSKSKSKTTAAAPTTPRKSASVVHIAVEESSDSEDEPPPPKPVHRGSQAPRDPRRRPGGPA